MPSFSGRFKDCVMSLCSKDPINPADVRQFGQYEMVAKGGDDDAENYQNRSPGGAARPDPFAMSQHCRYSSANKI